jgi:hypothetical protein
MTLVVDCGEESVLSCSEGVPNCGCPAAAMKDARECGLTVGVDPSPNTSSTEVRGGAVGRVGVASLAPVAGGGEESMESC